jgi:ketosteroid isomerase-like protein
VTAAAAEAFARDWIEAWNARDVERVLAHWSDDARFTSPKALETTGHATVVGKAALREYWLARVARIQAIHFTLDRVLLDATRDEVVIVYTAAIDGEARRACEFFRVGPGGRAVAGEAMYGAPV